MWKPALLFLSELGVMPADFTNNLVHSVLTWGGSGHREIGKPSLTRTHGIALKLTRKLTMGV